MASKAALAGGDFRRHVGFMHGLGASMGWPTTSPMAKMWGHVGAHLGIHRDETAVGDDDAGLGSAPIFLPLGARPPTRIMSYLTGSAQAHFAFEGDVEAVFLGVDGHRLGLQHDLVEAAGVLLFLPHLDGVPVGACIRPSIISTTSTRAPRVE